MLVLYVTAWRGTTTAPPPSEDLAVQRRSIYMYMRYLPEYKLAAVVSMLISRGVQSMLGLEFAVAAKNLIVLDLIAIFEQKQRIYYTEGCRKMMLLGVIEHEWRGDNDSGVVHAR